jgi:hypothetical protein
MPFITGSIDTRSLQDEANALALELNEGGGSTADRLRLTAIEELKSEVGGEFEDGVQLVPVSEFEDHARELAEDIGAIPSDASWPCTCIDWKRAARELQMDYTSVTFEGTDYLFRG